MLLDRVLFFDCISFVNKFLINVKQMSESGGQMHTHLPCEIIIPITFHLYQDKNDSCSEYLS